MRIPTYELKYSLRAKYRKFTYKESMSVQQILEMKEDIQADEAELCERRKERKRARGFTIEGKVL